MTHPFYYLTIMPMTDMRLEVSVNDFPLYSGVRTAGLQWSDILNLHCTGSEEVEITAAGAEGVAFVVTARRYDKGMIVTPDDGIDLPAEAQKIVSGATSPIVSDPTGRHLFSGELGLTRAQLRISTEGFDFSSHYRSGPQTPVEAALEFGGEVRRVFQAGDMPRLAILFRGLLEDRAIAWGDTLPETVEGFRSAMEGFSQAWREEPTVDGSLEGVHVAGGRMVEILEAGAPLLRLPGEDRAFLRVFVGQHGGDLTVLR